jgi:hypothetical protein
LAAKVREKGRAKGSTDKGEEPWAWSVGATWRGDLRLLARVARVVSEVAAGGEGEAELEIAVFARDDCERFRSPEELVERVTPQALRAFTLLTMSARGKGTVAEVLIARRKIYEPPFGGAWGVIVRALARDGPQEAKTMCDRLRIVARRGCSIWTRGLRKVETAPRITLQQKLLEMDGRRATLTKATVTMLAGTPFLLADLFLAHGPGRAAEKANLPYLTGAQLLILFVGPLLGGIVLPPIEVAELSPARRLLRLVGRSGVLSAGVGLLAALARVRLGLSS